MKLTEGRTAVRTDIQDEGGEYCFAGSGRNNGEDVQGMDHNVLSGDDLVLRYSERDLANHKKGKPYKIVKDETFGR